MSTAFVALENLIGTQDSLKGFHPDPEGLKLASALSASYRVLLAVVERTPESIEHWLMLNGLHVGQTYDSVVFPEPQDRILPTAEQYMAILTRSRAKGNDISLVISADPDFIELASREGYTTLLWVRPTYSRSMFSAPQAKPWGQIVEETERQLALKREAQRLELEAAEENPR